MATLPGVVPGGLETEHTSAAELKIPGLRKASILLTVLDTQNAADMLRQFDEREIHLLTREISRLSDVTEVERVAVLEEFMTSLNIGALSTRAGIDYATTLLVSAFGPDEGARIVERVLKSLGTDTPNLEALQKADPQRLANVIHGEHPRAIALILSHLGATHAAKVVSWLPADRRSEVLMRMGLLDQISPEVVNRITKTISNKLRLGGGSSLQAYGGVQAVAEILNRLDSKTSDDILKEVTERDAGLGETIRNLKFVFDDLINIDPESMRTLLGKLDRKILIMSLKGTNPQLQQHFTSFMSKRAAEMLADDMQALGPVRLRDVQEAQHQIVQIARGLEAEGLINLKPSAADQMIE